MQSIWSEVYELLCVLHQACLIGGFVLMIRRPPRSTRTDTLFPYTTLFRSLLLRRITRPLAQLATRVDRFARQPGEVIAMEPSGPQDIRLLIEAHNAMAARIGAMLREKDVMLGAIGNDLKTPLAELRVRIERVAEDRKSTRLNYSN